MLPPVDEIVRLELGRQLARGWQREAELAGELADGALPLRPDVGEHRDVPPAERRLALHQFEQLRRRSPPRPEPAHHPPQQAAELAQLGSGGLARNSDASMMVIIR